MKHRKRRSIWAFWLAELLCAAARAHQPILLDFGHVNHPAPSPDGAGRVWNHFMTTSADPPSGTLTNLLDETGAASGVRATIYGFGAGANTNGTTVPDAASLGSLAVSNATRDSFYVQHPSITGTLVFSGLVVGATYDLDLFGSRDAADTRRTRYTVTGLTTTSAILRTSGQGIGAPPEANANRSEYAALRGVSPNSQGVITVVVTVEEGPFGYLGAARLTRTSLPSTNTPPIAQHSVLTGPPIVGRRLRVNYEYFDAEADPEGSTLVHWYADSPPFTNSATPWMSGTNRWVIIPAALTGLYVRAVIVPHAQTGALTGTPAQTQWKGPIMESNSLAVFHVGNSFTRWGNVPAQLRNFAAHAGYAHAYGQQLTDGMGLSYHWSNGVLGGVITTGTPARLELETGGWDWLVLQPMSREWTDENRAAFVEFAARFAQLAASNGARVALYEYWHYLNEPDSTQDQISAVFEQVRNILASNVVVVSIIPCGQVFTAAVASVGGLTRDDLYRDNIHPSDVGYYLSALVHFGVLYAQAPTGAPPWGLSSDPDSDEPVAISPSLATALQAVAWTVCRVNPSTTVTRRRFERWALDLPPNFRAPADDPYGNGLPNLLRWAYGIPANVADEPAAHIRSHVMAPFLVVTYRVGEDAEDAGLRVQPEWSTNLTTWTAGWPAGFVTGRQDGWEVSQAPIASSVLPLYIRLRVLLP